MTALSAERNTPMMNGDVVAEVLSIPLAAAAKVYKGGLVALNSSGYGIAGSTSGVYVVGRAEKTVDNTSGAAGDLNVDVRRGAFRLANSSSTDALTRADVGKPCFLVDDQTVARTSSAGSRPLAGRVLLVDSDGVWVEIGVSTDSRIQDLLLLAAADYSTTGQYLFMGVDSSGNAVKASAAGQDCIGVLQNAPTSGAVAIVRVAGPTAVVASTTIAMGARLATTSAGKSKAAVAATTNTADAGAASDALVGSYVLGIALTAGATDTAHQMLLQPMGAIPTTAA